MPATIDSTIYPARCDLEALLLPVDHPQLWSLEGLQRMYRARLEEAARIAPNMPQWARATLELRDRTVKTLHTGARASIGGEGPYGPTSIYLHRAEHPTEAIGSLDYYGNSTWGVTIYSTSTGERFATRAAAAIHALEQLS